MNNFYKYQAVTLINGLRSGYVYLGGTKHRDIILNVLTGEIKQVYLGKLMPTAQVAQVVRLAA